MEKGRTMSVEDALAIRSFVLRSYVGISPDGGCVCYTLEEANRRRQVEGRLYDNFSRTGVSQSVGACSAWVADAVTGDAVCLGDPEASSWAPVWSPDGGSVAFYSDQSGLAQVWVWDRGTGVKRCISDRIARPRFEFERLRWTPDGRRLLSKLLPDGMTVEQANGPSQASQSEAGPVTECTAVEIGAAEQGTAERPGVDGGWTNIYLSDLVLLDVGTGASQTLAAGVRPIWADFSPDGSQLAFTEFAATRCFTSHEFLTRLVVLSVPDERETFSVSDLRFYFAITVSWSPNSRLLAYTAENECRVVDVAAQTTTLVPSDQGAFGTTYQPPFWAPDSRSLLLRRGHELWIADFPTWSVRPVCLSQDVHVAEVFSVARSVFWTTDGGKSAIVSAREPNTERAGVYRISLDSGRHEELMVGDAMVGGPSGFRLDVTADGAHCVFGSEDVAHPSDLWVSDSTFFSPKRATTLNPQLGDKPMGHSRVVMWVAAAGETLRGEVLLPAEYEEGRRYPLIVGVCPNRSTAYLHRYAIIGNPGVEFTDLQLFAARGYAVFVPEIHAAGPKMLNAYAECVMPGIDKLVELGIADPIRLGAIGQSGGGYGVLCLLVRTARFGAAVASASLSDWVTFATRGGDGRLFSHDYARDQLGAGLWEDRDRYIANSPLYFLDRVETPVLLIQGGLDTATSPYLAEQTFIGLKALGKDACYVRYDGESHGVGDWRYANRLDYTNRVIAWFDRYLGGGPVDA